ncbi:hypothetical protein HZ993_00230 [Rhodoferax sp. AJA081-3]|uniref:hypothetical protein n=1 Tax=Rhodoferax sp. AJA081-3 TaxID=2752316 RepID=UPI001AE03FAF|nr:hypothetical protein [Rhodoferax sp. AJA081-3]QTN28327.1 hypothetical protein HZ993_00230 [Rhodoferax sp. AJA081-3]
MTESELSQQVEWFHEFAKQSVEQLVLQATEENRRLFVQYVCTCLPNHSPPEGQSSEEFARTVVELRENERQWNQALMSVLIKADDLYKAQEWQSAVTKLKSFAQSCPWKRFEEIAIDQACNYKPQ